LMMNTSWSIRAWPPLLWQAKGASQLQFDHLDTQVFPAADDSMRHTVCPLGGASSSAAGNTWVSR
jgi:hypothetical protein